MLTGRKPKKVAAWKDYFISTPLSAAKVREKLIRVGGSIKGTM